MRIFYCFLNSISPKKDPKLHYTIEETIDSFAFRGLADLEFFTDWLASTELKGEFLRGPIGQVPEIRRAYHKYLAGRITADMVIKSVKSFEEKYIAFMMAKSVDLEAMAAMHEGHPVYHQQTA